MAGEATALRPWRDWPRAEIEALIELLIDRLDQFDGDPDLEPEPLEDDGDGEPNRCRAA